MINVFQRGETVAIWAYFKDSDGEYASPDQGVKVTLTDPDGTAQVDDQAMTESATGKFVYYYTTTSTSVLKWWRYKCTGQDGTDPDDKYSIATGSFELK